MTPETKLKTGSVTKRLFRNCEIYGPLSQGFKPLGGEYGYIVLLHILLKTFSLLSHLLGKVT